MLDALESQLIRRTLRVPAPTGPTGDGTAVARQLDIVLMSAGFKASQTLLESLGGLEPGTAMDRALGIIAAARELVGNHAEHNVYFRDFPNGVPDTVAFWAQCVIDALYRDTIAAGSDHGLSLHTISLLDLPTYGTYQHTYAEMLAAHRELIPHAKDRVTVLHLGERLDDEAVRLYHSLAGSRIPLSATDLTLLSDLALYCLGAEQPTDIPIRENRAHINRVRLAQRKLPLVDTVTDVLRMAHLLSGGDGTLTQHVRLRSFTQAERRAMLIALNQVIKASPAKVADVTRYRTMWKRLARVLHPYEHTGYPHAMEVFDVAHGRHTARSLEGQVEVALAAGDFARAVEILRTAPGYLFRQLDRLLRTAPTHADLVFKAAESVIDRVSGRVLLQLREHLTNRATPDHTRIFANRAGRAWVTEDLRRPLDDTAIAAFSDLLDTEITRRLPARNRIVVDPLVLGLAIPLSDKAKTDGFNILPRGSVMPLDGTTLSFFTYWRQTATSTDFDLSVALLDDNFAGIGHLSWTYLTGYGGVHSGDIVHAEHGATECIELRLPEINARYIVPQVLVYSGEGFDDVAEGFFGFMQREPAQFGQPFEARTVRAKSDLRGTGRVALPVMFHRDDNGTWSATWTHLNLRGDPNWRNTVESHHRSTATFARAITEHRYLTIGYLVDLMWHKANDVEQYDPAQTYDGPVTYIGLERPDNLPDGSTIYTLTELHELVPA